MAFVGVIIFVVVIFCIFGLIDAFTIKTVGINRVKCIDNEGAEFIDEWCEKEITCSWLGIKINAKNGSKKISKSLRW